MFQLEKTTARGLGDVCLQIGSHVRCCYWLKLMLKLGVVEKFMCTFRQ